MKLNVYVTAQDIAAGTRHASFCPVALAVKRATGLEYGVCVTYDKIYTYDISEGSETPARVATFLEHFDAGEPVEPFRFSLDLPDEVIIRIKKLKKESES